MNDYLRPIWVFRLQQISRLPRRRSVPTTSSLNTSLKNFVPAPAQYEPLTM